MAELPAAYTMYVLPHKQFLRRELERILRSHRNHPSFLSLAFGNEFDLSWLPNDAKRKEFLKQSPISTNSPNRSTPPASFFPTTATSCAPPTW